MSPAKCRPTREIPGRAAFRERERQIVVCRCASKFPVIANQSADWCGNPPVERNQVMITTKNREVALLCRAIVDTFYL